MTAQNEIIQRVGTVLTTSFGGGGTVYISNPYPVTNDGRAASIFLFPVDDLPGEKIERGLRNSQDVLDRRMTVSIVSTSDNLGTSTENLVSGYIALTEDVELQEMLCSQLDDLSISFGSAKAETRLQSASATVVLKYRAKRGTFEIIRRV